MNIDGYGKISYLISDSNGQNNLEIQSFDNSNKPINNISQEKRLETLELLKEKNKNSLKEMCNSVSRANRDSGLLQLTSGHDQVKRSIGHVH